MKGRKIIAKTKQTGFLLPSLIGTAIFFFIPFLVVIFYSVWNNPIQKQFVGLENFKGLLKNRAFLSAAKNTVIFSLAAVPLAVIVPLLVANLLTAQFPGKSKVRTFMISPIMVPTASVILIWQVLFSYNGQVNQWLAAFGVTRIDWFKSSYGMFAIVLLYLWKNLGYNMILFLAALSRVPSELVEAARVDGAGNLVVFFRLKLRFIAPSIVFVTLLSIISSFKVFREVYLLTGNHPHESVYMLQHFMNNMFGTLDYQKMSAAAVLIAGVLFVVVGLLFLLERLFGKDLEG